MNQEKFYLDGNGNPMKVETEKYYEMCPYCNDEICLETVFKYHKCPSCGKTLKPCALCKEDVECSKCRLDNTF